LKHIKHKAFAYITHQQKLLVFSHPYDPASGIQVPAGTIEEGEAPEKAALREAFEETGLTGFVLDRFLGEQERDMEDFGREEIHPIATSIIFVTRESLRQGGDMKNAFPRMVQKHMFSSFSGPLCLTMYHN